MSSEKNKCMNCDGPMPWPNDVCSNECQRELDGKSWEAKLDECHDVMRHVAVLLRARAVLHDGDPGLQFDLNYMAKMLDAARAGKAGA